MERYGNGLNEQGDAAIIIRQLGLDDLPRLIKIEHTITGRMRGEWFERKLTLAMQETDIRISLGAEVEGLLVGALMGGVHFGEFGVLEPVAVLHTVIVDPEYARKGVASALLAQFVENLRALRIARIRTEVDWNDLDLISFFGKSGFRPVARIVLEKEVLTED